MHNQLERKRVLNAETALINFDELLAKEMAAAAFKPTFLAKRFAFDTYREKHGLLLGTTQLIGQPLVGGTVQLTNPIASLAYFAVTRNPSFHAPASWSRPVVAPSTFCSHLKRP